MNVGLIALVCFILIGLLNIGFVKFNIKKGIYASKPILIPSLTFYYLLNIDKVNWLIMIALSFAFFGDIFLMLKERYFKLSIISFSMMHIIYILVLIENLVLYKIEPMFLLLIIPYIIFGAIMVKILWKPAQNMRYLFILYIIIVLLMGFSALVRIWNYEGYKFYLPFLGSIIFIISDSLIGFNRFISNNINNSTMIVITYLVALFMLIRGFI